MQVSPYWLIASVFLSFAALASGEEVDAPSMELLEYLGSWESGNGEWVDPMELVDVPFAQLEHEDSEKTIK